MNRVYDNAAIRKELNLAYSYRHVALLTSETAKISKSNLASDSYLTAVLHIAPNVRVCPQASPQCLTYCLNGEGRGRMSNVQLGRRNRTKLAERAPDVWHDALCADIELWQRKAAKQGKRAAIRLNGTSDIDYSHIARKYPNVQFYDYTKVAERAIRSLVDPSWPQNYDLTFSRSETNWSDCVKVLRSGGRVAIVASNWQDILARGDFYGHRVYDGVRDDLRFIEGPGIVVLKPLGKAKHAATSDVYGKSFIVMG